MKKIASILILAFAFTFVGNAQEHEKRKHHKKGEKMEKLSVEQQTTLAVKKMTLALDLTASQQRKITPLIQKQVTEKKEMRGKMKMAKERKKRPSAEERYTRANARLDKEIAFKAEMKKILNEEQFQKFKKMKKKKKRGKRKMKRKELKEEKRH